MTGREDITPHSLRHTCASMLVSSGMNPKELQMLLGHSSLDMTQRYAQMLKPQTEIAAETRKVFEGILEMTPGLA
jgi:site-specific recombinase XerD